MDAKLAFLLVLLLCLVVVVFVSPFFTIWSLNYLFHTEIAISFKSWCAVVWLLTVLHGIRFNAQKSG